MQITTNEKKENCLYDVVKAASYSTKEAIETIATDVGKSKHISLLDACGCTGNGPTD